jgi:hypothetical protein
LDAKAGKADGILMADGQHTLVEGGTCRKRLKVRPKPQQRGGGAWGASWPGSATGPTKAGGVGSRAVSARRVAGKEKREQGGQVGGREKERGLARGRACRKTLVQRRLQI